MPKQKEIVELQEDISSSSLYNEDLAPVPESKRTWSTINLAAIWVGMAVCVPTYLMAASMIKSGVSWYVSLFIIALANLIITIPMVLNGHAGVKYGIPFPVIGRASFGVNGVHVAAVVRAIVAAGWFGIQTWIGGLAFYAIWNAITGNADIGGLCTEKFICFALFWLLNIFFVWKGTESIKWLEEFSAPILILIGILLIVWGAFKADGFTVALDAGEQLGKPSLVFSYQNGRLEGTVNPLRDKEGNVKPDAFQISTPTENDTYTSGWISFENTNPTFSIDPDMVSLDKEDIISGAVPIQIQMMAGEGKDQLLSSKVDVFISNSEGKNPLSVIWKYILWLTAMVGFWATMSLSIADITRYASSQKAQVKGQFIGLPGTMVLYSFVGIFVTSAAILIFEDILIAEDAPWDPVSLLTHFESPWVVIISQVFMIIATLSTNLAANVIAPANAFANLFPTKVSFNMGGYITGIIGILVLPWLLLDYIVAILIFISGLLGPVLAIMLVDYFIIRKKDIKLAELYKRNGIYAYGNSGFNPAAMIALAAGILVAVIGKWVPALDVLYKLSWFTGFIVSFIMYYLLMRKHKTD